MSGEPPVITVLAVPGCPSLPVLIERLQLALGAKADEVSVIIVADHDEAVAGGMAGSPTLLVNGVDPFAGAGLEASLSCRLYRDSAGDLCGAPDLAQLRAALASNH